VLEICLDCVLSCCFLKIISKHEIENEKNEMKNEKKREEKKRKKKKENASDSLVGNFRRVEVPLTGWQVPSTRRKCP
jgi:hypothetical protein